MPGFFRYASFVIYVDEDGELEQRQDLDLKHKGHRFLAPLPKELRKRAKAEGLDA